MEKWILSGSMDDNTVGGVGYVVGGSVIGFCVAVIACIVDGFSVLDFVAATGDTIRFGELAVNLAFLGAVLGALTWAFVFAGHWEALSDEPANNDATVPARINIAQGNRIVTLYESTRGALELIGKGVSRRSAVAQGITEYAYNKTLAELKKRGVTGKFDVT